MSLLLALSVVLNAGSILSNCWTLWLLRRRLVALETRGALVRVFNGQITR